MARRKQSGFETMAALPWPISIVLGLLGYIAIRHGIGWYLGATDNPYTSGLGNLAASGIYAPLGWLLLGGCWVAALASFFGRRNRRQLLDKQSGIGSLRQMSWRQFEQLTGEAFRRQGYAVEETGLGGPDGGIDLILRKNGQTTLVQCKQWQNWQVSVKVVREMYGLLTHHQAAAVKIVALGDYTSDARRFAQGKPIELIHASELFASVHPQQTRSARATGPMGNPLAFSGSMVASLLLIAALSPSNTRTSKQPAVEEPGAAQPAVNQESPSTPGHEIALSPRARTSVHERKSGDEEELRQWKRQNAESMRILEKTTKEMPLR